jgi:signal transduction histidine kinase
MGSGAAQERARTGELLAEKAAALGRLAAGIAHELRNPLAVILARTQLLRLTLKNGKPVEPGKLEHTLAVVEEQTLRAAKIIENLSVFARPRAPQLERVDLSETIRQVLAALGVRKSEGAPIATDVHVAADARIVLADPGQLATALTQLARNAIDAMPNGGTLQVHVRRDGDGVDIMVADTGDGMAAHDVPKIFDPFFSTRPGAPGLGLCVAQTIAEAHGGSLRLVETGQAGSEFRLSLPARG